MCHTVRTRNDYTFVSLAVKGRRGRTHLLLGAKDMCWSAWEECYYSPYRAPSTYTHRPCSLGYEFTCHKAVRHQDLSFSIMGHVVHYRGKVRAGLHIAPFLNGASLGAFFLSHTYTVAFKPKDVVFFDGADASVRRFYVLDPDKVLPHAFITGECTWSLSDVEERLRETWNRVSKGAMLCATS